jgi:hypothetical protein
MESAQFEYRHTGDGQAVGAQGVLGRRALKDFKLREFQEHPIEDFRGVLRVFFPFPFRLCGF